MPCHLLTILKVRRLLPAVFILILPVAAPRAATYHVATSGSNTNPGSAAQPWRTLQKAADTVRPGDVVLVSSGPYAGVYISTDGSAAAPITFRAEGDVVVNAPNNRTPDNINIEGADYVTIEGFRVENAPRVGIRAVLATGVVIRDNVVRRSGLTGILTGFTPRIEISGNVASESVEEHGIYVSNSTSPSDNPIVRGNECFGNGTNGIQFNGDCDSGGDGVISGALIEGNFVHHNNWKGLSLISLQASTIRNNVIYENGLEAGAGGIHLADQPGCGKPSNSNLVANNTIHEPRITGIRMSNGSTANVIFNNLVVSSKPIVDEGSGNFIDPASNLQRGSPTGLFVSPGTANYHLAPQSPAIEEGALAYHGAIAPVTDAVGAARPQGLMPDAGAYEWSSSTGVTNAPTPGISLEQNAPNPFNPSTRIAYTVSAVGARVDIGVFDVRGSLVRTLVDGRPSSGRVVVVWDGRDDAGREVPSGVYFYRLTAGPTTITRRMTLLK